MAGLTAEGFVAKTYAEILADIEARQLAAFGEDFDVAPESPAGVVNGPVANAARLCWEGLAGLAAAFDPDGATDAQLTSLALITGTERKGAQRGRVPLVLGVAAGATVPAGSVADVASDPTSRWLTLTAATNTGASSASFTVEAEQETAGPLPAAATTISHIATPVTGWLSVTNLEPAAVGLDAETDPVLRRRREEELQGAGTTPAEAIRAALRRIPLVSEVVVWENPGDATDADGRPRHSVEAMVLGGEDAAIAAVLWASVARGIQTTGGGAAAAATTVTTTVADEHGDLHEVKFTRPADLPVWVIVEVKVSPRLDPGDAAIIAAVRATFDGLGAGQPVLRAVLSCAALNVTGVTNVTSVRLGTISGSEVNADLEVSARARAVSPTSVYVEVQRA
jgi:uncharacterized phage protein gp47/JayE